MNKYIKNNRSRLKHIRTKIQNAMRKVGIVGSGDENELLS